MIYAIKVQFLKVQRLGLLVRSATYCICCFHAHCVRYCTIQVFKCFCQRPMTTFLCKYELTADSSESRRSCLCYMSVLHCDTRELFCFVSGEDFLFRFQTSICFGFLSSAAFNFQVKMIMLGGRKGKMHW